MSKKLKPCPFCGKKTAEVTTVAYAEEIENDNPYYSLYCNFYTVVCNYNNGGCGSSVGKQYETTDEAIEAWNRRAENG